MGLLLFSMCGAPCAPLSLCLLPPLQLFLLGLFNRFVDSNLYLAFHPFLAEAALGRQVVKVSISFYAGQHRLEALAKARDRTPHYLMKAAVERFLDVEEALEAERQLAKDRWQKYELTGETVDHADVKAWAASLGDTGADVS